MKRFMVLLFVILIFAAISTWHVTQKAEKPDVKEVDKVSIRLTWMHGYQSIGFYVSEQKGFYAEENLEVTLAPRKKGLRAIEAVISGQNDFGVGGMAYILGSQEQSSPVVAIASLYQQNPTCIISFKDLGIVKPQDLVGRSVRVFSEGWTIQDRYRIFLKKVGIKSGQIKEVVIRSDMSPFYNREVDAWLCQITGTAARVKAEGHDVNVILFKDYGVLTYNMLIFTTPEMIEGRPDVVERFIRASLRGWRWSIENPAEAADMVLIYDPNIDREAMLASHLEAIPLMYTGENPIGWIEREVWEIASRDLQGIGVVKRKDIDAAFTMEFLKRVYK